MVSADGLSSLNLSEEGHEVVIAGISVAPEDELGCDSLTPIAAIEDRVREWNSISDKKNDHFRYLDLKNEYAEPSPMRVGNHYLCSAKTYKGQR